MWTAPSHYNCRWASAATSPQHVYASEYHKEDFFNYNQRLGAKGIDFGAMVPGLCPRVPRRANLGYEKPTRAFRRWCSTWRTAINRGFDSFELMEHHNDMRAMLLTPFPSERPSFYMLNVGETHYPYAPRRGFPFDGPRISGVNGVFRKMNAEIEGKEGQEDRFKESFQFFDQDRLDQLRARQIDTVRYLDEVFTESFTTWCPRTPISS
ncbi:MAG: hypothetical protein R3E96_03565 [Planctomycetota bacterium]